MSYDTDPLERARQFLGSGNHQGWIFGVCTHVARRTGWDLWIVRLVAVLGLLTLSIASAVVYVALGMLMDETRPRSQRKLRRWAGQADHVVDVIWRGGKRFFDQARDSGVRSEADPMARN